MNDRKSTNRRARRAGEVRRSRAKGGFAATLTASATFALAAIAGGAELGDLLLRIPNPVRTSGENFGATLGSFERDLLVGAPDASRGGGIVYLIDGVDGLVSRTISPPADVFGSRFGATLVPLDGALAIGAPGRSSTRGSFARVVLYDTNRQFERKISASASPGIPDAFGAAMAVWGDRLLVGDPTCRVAAVPKGAVHIIDPNDPGDRSVRTIANPFAPEIMFGAALAVTGDRLIVGASLDDSAGVANGGAIVIFDLSAEPRPIQGPINPAPQTNAWLGATVAAAGDWVAAGAPRFDDRDEDGDERTDVGRVYIFEAASGKLLREIAHPDPGEGDTFGASLAAWRDYLIVGAPGKRVERSNGAGGAYLFNVRTGERLLSLENGQAGQNEAFGYSVAWSRGDIVIGAPRDDLAISGGGAVFVYEGPGDSDRR